MLNKNLLFDCLLDSSPDILIFFDASLRVQAMSKEAKRLFGFSKETFFNKDLSHIFKKRHITIPIASYVKQLGRKKKIKLYETELFSGKVSHVISWQLELITEESPNDKFYLLIGKNITDLRKLENKFQATEHILNITPNFLYWKDRNSVYQGCNNYFACLVDLDKKEVIGKTDFDFAWKDQALSFQADDKEVLTSGKPKLNVEHVGNFKNDKIMTIITNKVPLTDLMGNIIGILGVATDITLRKEEEIFFKQNIEKENFNNIYLLKEISKEIMGSEFLLGNDSFNSIILLNFLKNIIADMPGNVYWKDKHSIYMGGNNGLAKKAGFSSRLDIVGKDDFYFEKRLQWEPGTAARFRQNDKEVMSLKASKTFEDILIQADGSKVVMLTTKAPIFDENKEVIGVLATSLDITRLKEQELELRKAKEEAEALSRAKTDFLSNMSHDVKTPLSGIISFAELLRVRVQPELRNFIQELENSAKQVLGFFENCITLSKLENHSLVLSQENFSLKCLVYETVQLFRASILAKKLLFYIEYSEKIPKYVLGNRNTLYRILLNLISNAIKFTHQGFIKIVVALSQKSTEEKVIIQLKIIDTGIGITEKEKGLIFEKFSRLTPSYNNLYEGHGIGLYIVHQFIASMGGQIYVKSQEGEGSQFTLAIPFERPLLADDEYEVEKDVSLDTLQILSAEIFTALTEKVTATVNDLPQDPNGAVEASTLKIRVLLVEDDARAQLVTKMILEEDLNCHVDVANCGEKALILFEPGKYHLVFMDIGLPDMKGYEVSRSLREMEKSTSFHVPILGLSAHASLEDKQLSEDAGMQEMFSKPLLRDQAKELLARYVISEEKSLSE